MKSNKLKYLIRECISELIEEGMWDGLKKSPLAVPPEEREAVSKKNKEQLGRYKTKPGKIKGWHNQPMKESELLQEFYGGYQIFVFADGTAYVSRYPKAHDELEKLGKEPKAVSVPIDFKKLEAEYGEDQLEPLRDPKHPNIIQLPIQQVRSLAATHKIKFKKLVPKSDVDNYPQGIDNTLASNDMHKKVAVAGQVPLDSILYTDN
jgi:hypothetical protein